MLTQSYIYKVKKVKKKPSIVHLLLQNYNVISLETQFKNNVNV